MHSIFAHAAGHPPSKLLMHRIFLHDLLSRKDSKNDIRKISVEIYYFHAENNTYSKNDIRVCLDDVKNSVRIEKLRIANEDSEK
jgi:hypothetical protein